MMKSIKHILNIQGKRVTTLKDSVLLSDNKILNECLFGTAKTGKAIPKALIDTILKLKPENIKKAELRGDGAYAFLKQSVVIFDRKNKK